MCVIISIWDGVMDSMCGPQHDVLFHLPHFVCVCTDTPFSCLQTFLALLINSSALSLTPHPTPSTLSLISLVPGSCRLRHVMSNADNDHSSVHTADLNLYRSSHRLSSALLLNFECAFYYYSLKSRSFNASFGGEIFEIP